MPAAGYTPILLYGSATASAVPAAANLTNGTGGSEIAINITDGRLYYKDNNGAVQLIGAKLNSVLAAALASAPTGTGAVVLATGPTLTLPNATGLPLTTGVTGLLPIANGGTNAFTAPSALTNLGAAALAGSATQAFSVANATAATQAAALGQTIGAGATAYSNVTGSRALNTAYTNTTSRPLVVAADVLLNIPYNQYYAALAKVDGITVNGTWLYNPFSSPGISAFDIGLTFIVPPSSTYTIGTSGSGNSITSWLEY